MRRRKEYMRRMTQEEKILFYLYERRGLAERYVVPEDVTQAGLSELLGVKQSHISRALTDLKRRGLVYERTSHIVGTKRRKKAYFLTERGEEEVRSLREDLLGRYITVRDGNGKYREWTVGRFLREINDRGALSFFEMIHDHIQEEGGHLVGVVKTRQQTEKSTDIPPIGRFYGRKKELARIEEALHAEKIKLITVISLPGQGKTTLVSRSLRGITDRHIFWYNIYPWTGLNTLLASLISFIEERGLRLPKEGAWGEVVVKEQKVTERILEALARLNAIVVLDNFHSAEERIVEWVRILFSMIVEKNSAMKVILISRWRPSVYPTYQAEMGRGVLEIILEGLEKESALQMLADYGIRGREALKAYDITRGHPLAIQLYSLRPGKGEEELRTSLKKYVEEEVLDSLPVEERRLLQYLSLFRLPFKERAVSPFGEEGFEALRRLRRKMLIRERSDGLLEMHELLKEIVSSSVMDGWRREFSEKILDYYRGEGGIEAAVERIYFAMKARRWEVFLSELLRWGSDIAARGYLEIGEWLELAREMKVSEWERAQLDLIEAEHLITRGEPERVQRLLRRVEMRVKGRRGRGWKKVKIHLLELQALTNVERGVEEEALKQYRESLRISRESGEHIEEAKILNNMGVLYLKGGKYNEALRCFKNAEKILSDVGGGEQLITVVLNRGDALIKKGEIRRGKEAYRRALEMAEDIGTKALQGVAMERLSEIYFSQGRRSEAVDLVKEAIRYYINAGEGERATNLLLRRFKEVLKIYGREGVLSFLRELNGGIGWRRILGRRFAEDGKSALTLIVKVMSGEDADFEGYFERFDDMEEFVRRFTLLQRAIRAVAPEKTIRKMYSAARFTAEGLPDKHPLTIVLLKWGEWERGKRSLELLREAKELAERIGFLSALRRAEEILKKKR